MREGWEATRDETRDTFEEIVQQVDRITEIIDHMRVFARDSGPSETGSVRISDVVQGALKLVGAQLRVHGITTTVDVPEGLPGAAGQPNRIEEVLLNLVINARDAVEERRKREAAGWRGSLAIRAETDPDVKELRLSLSDNGGGIPEFVVDRIFDPFFTTKEVGRGTGLGLSIARGIVERYGGRLELQNRLGEGATFTIVLPIAEGAG
jgi:C4-dicarboxylate-specific signal transduction histidine kinase